VVLWTDQSRRPSAIDAPSHHGFDPYHHCCCEYSLPFFGNPQHISNRETHCFRLICVWYVRCRTALDSSPTEFSSFGAGHSSCSLLASYPQTICSSSSYTTYPKVHLILWSNYGPLTAPTPTLGATRVAGFQSVTTELVTVMAEVASSSLVVPLFSNNCSPHIPTIRGSLGDNVFIFQVPVSDHRARRPRTCGRFRFCRCRSSWLRPAMSRPL